VSEATVGKVKRSVNLEPEMWAGLTAEAQAQCSSVNAVLRQAVRAYLDAKSQTGQAA
jgi:predicted transcriptional regulator